MALIPFFKNTGSENWQVGLLKKSPAGVCTLELTPEGVYIVRRISDAQVVARGKYTDFSDATGTVYASGAAFETAVDGFFVKPACVETDPVFAASPAGQLTANDIKRIPNSSANLIAKYSLFSSFKRHSAIPVAAVAGNSQTVAVATILSIPVDIVTPFTLYFVTPLNAQSSPFRVGIARYVPGADFSSQIGQFVWQKSYAASTPSVFVRIIENLSVQLSKGLYFFVVAMEGATSSWSFWGSNYPTTDPLYSSILTTAALSGGSHQITFTHSTAGVFPNNPGGALRYPADFSDCHYTHAVSFAVTN